MDQIIEPALIVAVFGILATLAVSVRFKEYMAHRELVLALWPLLLYDTQISPNFWMLISDIEHQPASVGRTVNIELSTRPPSCRAMMSSTKWQQERGARLCQTNIRVAFYHRMFLLDIVRSLMSFI